MPSIHSLLPTPAGVRRLALHLALALSLSLSSPLLLSVVTVSAEAQTASASSQAAVFEAALDEYEANRWPQAYAALARLADGSHADAARIALLILRHGRPLYGMDFTASAQQRQHWAQAAGALAPAARRATR